LHVTENSYARFKVGEVFKLPGQPQCVPRVARFERDDLVFCLLFIVQRPRALALGFGGFERARVLNAHRAFGHGNNAEIRPVTAAAFDGIGDFLNVVGNFRD
jgi:hypothetical protein